MGFKAVIIGIIILIVVAGGSYLMFKPAEYYSDEPADWIERTATGKMIDVERASNGQVFDNGNNQYFLVNGTMTSFLYEGFYQGEYFTNQYRKEGRTLMRVGTSLNPGDGVMEGFAMERVNDGVYEILIFLDEDWRRQLPDTNIIWGAKYQKAKQFAFDQISSGIYMEIIKDDAGRFGDNHRTSYSGIIVGDVSQDDVLAGNRNGKTLLIFQ